LLIKMQITPREYRLRCDAHHFPIFFSSYQSHYQSMTNKFESAWPCRCRETQQSSDRVMYLKASKSPRCPKQRRRRMPSKTRRMTSIPPPRPLGAGRGYGEVGLLVGLDEPFSRLWLFVLVAEGKFYSIAQGCQEIRDSWRPWKWEFTGGERILTRVLLVLGRTKDLGDPDNSRFEYGVRC
jgi:hypothetical protein